MKSSFNVIIALVSLVIFSCKKEVDTSSSYTKGSLTVVTDEAFKSVTEALADAYMMNYTDTNVKVKVQKEDLNIVDLLNRKESLIVMSRDLTKEEKEIYRKRFKKEHIPANFAVDAVLFVVPKNSPLEYITLEDIQSGLVSPDKKFIFDDTNASNLNFVAQKIGKNASDLKFGIIEGNANLAMNVEKYKSKIGVISLNTISREFSPEAQKLKEKIKVLPIKVGNDIYTHEAANLRSLKYPFTRVAYFLTSDSKFGIANGFIRYSCTQIGQMVVQKEGLQPYNLYKRQVQMR